MITKMIKKTTVNLAVIILLSAINSCYYEREIHEELEICFVRGNNIWIMNMDGSSQRQITFSGFDSAPSWSPDGQRILFSNDNSTTNIYIINSDGTNLKKITNSIVPNSSSSPTWSSDGEKIFFCEYNGINYSIIAAKPDGTILNIYPTTVQASYLSVSPAEKYIYFSNSTSLYKLDLTTGVETSLAITTTSQISFSPDGKYFAHSDGAIYIYNIETGITTDFSPGTAYPCWTPDGKTIVFMYASNIYKINVDGTNQQQLTFTGGCFFPCVKWKPI